MFAEEWDYDTALEVRAEEARMAALAEGRAEGEARGRAEGEARGRIAAVLENVRSLMANYKLSIQDAFNALNIAPADRPAILAAL